MAARRLKGRKIISIATYLWSFLFFMINFGKGILDEIFRIIKEKTGIFRTYIKAKVLCKSLSRDVRSENERNRLGISVSKK